MVKFNGKSKLTATDRQTDRQTSALLSTPFGRAKIEIKNEPVETPVEEIKQQRKNLKNTLNEAWRVKTGRVEKTEKARRRTTCKKCEACQVSQDCGECLFCLDKPKYGGPNKLKKKCREKICQNMGFQN